jgi:hypothetical protein
MCAWGNACACMWAPGVSTCVSVPGSRCTNSDNTGLAHWCVHVCVNLLVHETFPCVPICISLGAWATPASLAAVPGPGTQ